MKGAWLKCLQGWPNQGSASPSSWDPELWTVFCNSGGKRNLDICGKTERNPLPRTVEIPALPAFPCNGEDPFPSFRVDLDLYLYSLKEGSNQWLLTALQHVSLPPPLLEQFCFALLNFNPLLGQLRGMCAQLLHLITRNGQADLPSPTQVPFHLGCAPSMPTGSGQ